MENNQTKDQNFVALMEAASSSLARRHGKRHFASQQTSLSFLRGAPERFLVVSGLVKLDRNYEARFQVREHEKISSRCDCALWSEDHHCSHVMALVYHYQETLAEKDSSPLSSSFSSNAYQGKGVGTEVYGTLVNQASFLTGASPSATFSSLQYLLTSGKTVSLPLPSELKGQIVAHIPPGQEVNTRISFSYIPEEGEAATKISIFRYTHLFNWESGEYYDIPSKIQMALRAFGRVASPFELDELLKIQQEANERKGIIQLYLGQTPLEVSKAKSSYPVWSLSNDGRSKHTTLKFQFVNDDKKIIPTPFPLRVLCFTDIGLGQYKRKQDAFDFLQGLIAYLEDGKKDFKHSQFWPKNRETLFNIADQLFNSSDSFSFTQELGAIKYDGEVLTSFVKWAILSFESGLFRYSREDKSQNAIIYEVPTNALLGALGPINRALNPYGLDIFYKGKQAAKWNASTTFVREGRPKEDWFGLEMSFSRKDWEIIKQAKKGQDFILSDEGLIFIDNQQRDFIGLVKKYIDSPQKTIEEDGDKKKIKVNISRNRIFELFELKKLGIDGLLNQEEEEICKSLLEVKELPILEPPAKLNADLRDYQKVGLSWLHFLYKHKLGACLADDMGLGKTIQAISFLLSIESEFKQALVICPVSLLLNWENEINKFSDLSCEVFHGGERSFKKDTKIILTSYGILRREMKRSLKDTLFDIVIFDEVQHLKNPRSLGAQAARELKAGFRLALTGTPVENDINEFFNIMDLAIPGLWGHQKLGRKMGTKETRFMARKLARPFILRRTKKQVLSELPPKEIQTAYLEPKQYEKESYQNTLKNIQETILNNQSKKLYGEILKGLLRLRQLCLWTPFKGQRQEEHNYYQHNLSSKIDFLLETLDSILQEGHQTIIFSQFTSYLDLIQESFEKRHWKYSRIDGSQSLKKRQGQVDLFQEGKNPLFLISLKAGGFGLNLTAASYVFIMDPWWNPAVEGQAIDRAHRIGQKNKLTIYRPIIKGSIEEKVLKLQERKHQLFRDLLPEDSDSEFSSKLTMRDFQDLLEID